MILAGKAVDNASSRKFGVVSLYDLREFLGSNLCALSGLLGKLEMVGHTVKDSVASPINISSFKEQTIVPTRDLLRKLDLTFSLAYIGRIEDELDNPRSALRISDFGVWSKTLRERIQDEMENELLFSGP